jgi:small conductance mechanosensitive channel
MPTDPVCRLARILLAGFLALLLLLPSSDAPAQTAESPAEAGMSGAELEQLVRTLEDPQARARLIAELKALKAAQDKAAGIEEEPGLGALLLSTLSENIREASDEIGSIAAAVEKAPRLIGWFREQATNPHARAMWLDLLWKIAAILAAAMAAEWIAGRILSRPRLALENRAVEKFWWRLPYASAHLLLELLPIAAFLAVAYGTMSALTPGKITSVVALVIINANLLARLVMAATRALLSPRARGLRLLNLGDETANYLCIWVRRVGAFGIYGYFIVEAGLLLRMPASLHAALLRAVGLLVAAMLAIFVLQNRAPVAAWLKGGRGDGAAWARMRRRIADVWHVLAILYIFAIYGVWALNIAGGFQFLFRASLLTVLLLAAARLLTKGIVRLVERGFALSADLKARFPGLEGRANRYLPLLRRILVGAIYAIAGFALLEIWGLGALDWLGSEFGQRLTRSLITIGFILLAALLATEIVNALVERFLQRRQRDAEDPGRGARLRTLLPLLRNAFRIIVVVMVTLIVLSELGINIAPLLAGAGVVGLAIGFGAQTLVKDVITGIFILAEDTVAVGDVVDLEGRSGVVEAMTIRSIRLRDGAGAVHTVPFSAVTTVKNMTKNFANVVFDVNVGYDADFDKVTGILRAVGDEVRADPKFARDILEPMAVAGIVKFLESGMTIQAHMKTRPMRQWEVRNEVHLKLRRAFADQGIEFAVPQRHITHRWENAPPAETLARKSIGGLG